MKCTSRKINLLGGRTLGQAPKSYTFILFIFIIIWLLPSCEVVTDTVETVFYQTDPHGLIMDFERTQFNRGFQVGNPFTTHVAVTPSDVPMEGLSLEGDIVAGALFSTSQPRVLFGYNMFERLYPASTTKVMTALVAIHYGNMEDVVTVSESAVNFGFYAQVGGLQVGDQVSMEDLIGGLMLHSGNDNAVAIAEHIAGSEEAFVQLMNEKAYALGATHTNFVNSHGLHHDNHFTTLYDLYLIFNSLARDQRFLDFIAMPYVSARIIDWEGEVRYENWYPTNWFNYGTVPHPPGVTVLGGKTGYTDQAGACLILFNRGANHEYYISIIMGSSTREYLYEHMTFLLSHGLRH